jgi:hypothetical protein
MALKEIAANRGFVDFVFSVQAPWHRKRVCRVPNGEAFLDAGERLEALFLEEDSN